MFLRFKKVIKSSPKAAEAAAAAVFWSLPVFLPHAYSGILAGIAAKLACLPLNASHALTESKQTTSPFVSKATLPLYALIPLYSASYVAEMIHH